MKKATKKSTPSQDLMKLHKKYLRLQIERDGLKHNVKQQSITIHSQARELMTLRGLVLSHIQESRQEFKRPVVSWSTRLKTWWEHVHTTMNNRKVTS